MIVRAAWPRRHPVAAIVVLLLLVLGVLDRGLGVFGQEDDRSRYHDKAFRVVRVVDGDTLDIDIADGKFASTRLRLWGVDSPEVTGSPGGVMHYGAEASAFARESLLNRPVRVVLSPARTRDKYGRLLAYVFLDSDGECFNERLLETGHAYADWRFDHPRKTQYLAMERRARSQGVGLWADVTPDRYPPWRRETEEVDH